MPLRDMNFSANHIVILLVVLAVIVGVLIAIQGANLTVISESSKKIENNILKIEKLEKDFNDYKRASDLYQIEQRQSITDFSKALNTIQVEQAKKGRH